MNKIKDFLKQHQFATKIFVASFLIHLLVSIFLYQKFGESILWFENEDAHSYLNLADSLLIGEGFSRDGMPSAYRTPLYPIFLVLAKLIPGSDIWAIIILQNILASFSAVLLYQIGKMFFSERVGKLVGLIYIFEPYMLMTAVLATTETFFNFLLILFIYFFGRYYSQTKNCKDIIISGVLLGLLVLTRPVALYLPIFIIILLAIRYLLFQVRDWQKFVFHTFVLLLVFVLVLSPWLLRQEQTFGRSKITNIDSFMLFARVAPIVVMKEENLGYIDAAKLHWQRFVERTPDYRYEDVINNFKYYDELVEETKEIIKKDPLSVAKFYTVSAVPAMLGTGYEYILEDVMGVERKIARVSYTETLLTKGPLGLINVFKKFDIFQAILFFSLALWSLIYLLILFSFANKNNWQKYGYKLVLLVALSLYFILLTLGPASHVRYRMPSFPALFLLLGFGLEFFIETCKLRLYKRNIKN